jgi:hypothetical protein
MKWLLPVILLAACAAPAEEEDNISAAPATCDSAQNIAALPSELKEASGVAVSRRNPGTLWVHNDSGDPFLFAIDTLGRVRGRVRITNLPNNDWEDIAAGDCADGPCLYIGATGDNRQNRSDRGIHRLLEPALGDTVAEVIETIPYRLENPSDVEAFFVVGQEIFLLTKGRNGPIVMYRFPDKASGVPVLEVAQQLTTGLVQLPDMVTSAGATPDGRYVVIRSYSALQLYSFENHQLTPLLGTTGYDLQPLNEFQGEGADIAANGVVYLVSEKGLSDDAPPLSKVACSLSAR